MYTDSHPNQKAMQEEEPSNKKKFSSSLSSHYAWTIQTTHVSTISTFDL